MTVLTYVPERVGEGFFRDVPVPGSGDDDKALTYDHSTGKFVYVAFDAAGTAAAAVAAHVALSNPHTQYALGSALGTAATLNVGTGANNVVQLNGSAKLPAVDGSQLTNLPGGAVAGSTTQVIFNDAGAYGGDAGLTYAKATDRLTVVGGLVAPSMRPASDSTTAVQVQNAAGTALVTVDTTNGRVGIGATTIRSRLEVKGGYRNGINLQGSGSATSRAHLYIGDGTNGVNSDEIYLDAVNTNFNFRGGGAGDTLKFILGSNNVIFPGGYRTSLAIRSLGSATLRSHWYIGDATNGTVSDEAYLDTINSALHLRTGASGTTDALVCTAAGLVAIGQTSATALLDLAASTTARASLRIRSGTAPTTPNDGDIWFDGTDLKCRIGGVTKTFTVT